MVAGQFVILIPPVIMAILLTSQPARTLRLAWPEPRYLVLAVALVLALNPLVNELRPVVEWLFPISSMIKDVAGAGDGPGAEPGSGDRRLRPDPGDLRGVRVPRLHPLRAGAADFNPLVNELKPLVEWLFPISSVIKISLSQVMSKVPSLAVTIGVFALVPAICEEFAFRGFILSGLEHDHRTRSAILLSALMFGFLHVLLCLFQQLFNATLLGIVLGLLAVRSRSILPGIVFHFLNNAIAVSQGHLVKASWARSLIPWIYRKPDEGLYHVGVDSNERDRLGELAVLPLEAEIRSNVRGEARLRRGTLTLQARYVLPVEGPPIEGACLTIERGRIAWVGPAGEREEDLDLGNVAIVPGFVNAHTHLELEPIDTARPGQEDESEIPWLRRVIDQRRGGTEESQSETVARNIRSAIEAGTTFLADTTTAGLSWGPIAEAPLRALVFAELIGLKRYRGLETSESAWRWLGSVRPEMQVAACAGPGSARMRPTARRAGSITRRSPAGCRSRPTWRRCPRSCDCSSTATARCAASSKSWAPGTTTGSRSVRGRPTTCAAASCATPTG